LDVEGVLDDPNGQKGRDVLGGLRDEGGDPGPMDFSKTFVSQRGLIGRFEGGVA
jgi:hypothetical protein